MHLLVSRGTDFRAEGADFQREWKDIQEEGKSQYFLSTLYVGHLLPQFSWAVRRWSGSTAFPSPAFSTRRAERGGRVNRLPINSAAPSELLRARETGVAQRPTRPSDCPCSPASRWVPTRGLPQESSQGPFWGPGDLGGSQGILAELEENEGPLTIKYKAIKYRACLCL